ncbi:UNVERIFIED_ORG: hypothetical protein E4P37_17270 [Bacillus sp. AZ43]
MPTDPAADDLRVVLREHGLLADADIASVTRIQQRSACALVTLDDGRVLFVKQARRDAAGTWTADVPGEGDRMRRLSAVPSVRPLMPALLAVDRERRLLVVEGLAPAVPLDEARRARGGSDPARAAALGRALAALHDGGRAVTADLPVVDHVGPALRSWSRPTPRSVTLYPPGYREIVVRIHRGDLLDDLGAVAEGWRQDTVIHGDVKSDNVLCDAPSPVRLIDWECAGRGDARWDVGSAVGDYLVTWLRTMRVSASSGLAGWIDTAQPPLPHLRAELTALLDAYRDARTGPDGGGSADEEMAAWMRYAGMFLLHRLTMTAMQAVEVSSHSLALLQLSRQLVRSPQTALEVLLP